MRNMIGSGVLKGRGADAQRGATIARGCASRNPRAAAAIARGRAKTPSWLRSVRAGLLALLLAAVVPARAADAGWSVRITPYDRLYPALELSQARRERPQNSGGNAFALGAGSGLVAVRLRSRHAGERVSLSVDAPGLDAPARIEATLPEAGRDYVLRPPLAWNPRQLRESDAPRDVNVDFHLLRDGADAGTRSLRVSLRPLSEALYFVRDGADSVDLSWIFAAYVDEHDAVVDQVLAAAIRTGIVDRFDGYAQDSADAVYRQAWAVWQALAAHGIRYSSADPGIARGPRIFSQRVRLLEQTWSDRSANCIDGSVLIASVLQRIGLRSFLVLVPGHAFVGFHTDAAGERAAYLETTLLGAAPRPLVELPAFAADFDVATARRLDIAGFVAALDSGRRRYSRSAGRFDRRHRPDYALIDIGAARSFGILPIEAAAGANGKQDGTSQPGTPRR
jgi:hypothetical protein